MKLYPILFVTGSILSFFSCSDKAAYRSDAFQIYPDRVVQGSFEAGAKSPVEMYSTYKSDFRAPVPKKIDFKFSINGGDNERYPGEDHHAVLVPRDEKMISLLYEFGEPDPAGAADAPAGGSPYLEKDVNFTVRADMRHVLSDFEKQGYFVTATGQKIMESDFRGVFIAGNTPPLSWEFDGLGQRKESELHDPDGDGIYEITLHFKQFREADTPQDDTLHWELHEDISAYPSYSSPRVLVDALYNKALEEMVQDIREDGAFMAGKKWPGVWTRDISYSILLSLAIINPQAAMISLKAKVKNDRIIQDTGTGGSWPVSTDRMTWALAAWEVYKVTGDRAWLEYIWRVIGNSASDDLETAFNPQTGLFYGESSFLDWREQTYPEWMDPKDIYQSHSLGTNAVHYETYRILARMAAVLGEDASIYEKTAALVKDAINEKLWSSKNHYYGQYLYGRNYLSLSSRSETLGEALCTLFEIPGSERRDMIFRNVPVTNYGPPCVYPQTPGIPPYHNDAVWPFVAAYWTWAAARAGNEKAVEYGLASIYRAAALFMTNKENLVASTGDYMGTEINSDRQLWSVAGNLATVYRVFFGMKFKPDSLRFEPFIPESYGGKKHLSNFSYRQAKLDITVEGFGSGVSEFLLDGQRLQHPAIPGNLSGKHTLLIRMNREHKAQSEIRLAENRFAPETPQVYRDGSGLHWQKCDNTTRYLIFKNGNLLKETTDTLFAISDIPEYAEYQVMAVGGDGLQSFLSEPVAFAPDRSVIILEAGKKKKAVMQTAEISRKDDYLELTRKQNTHMEFMVEIDKSGAYSLDGYYANGSGPVNTNNRCAIRTVLIDGKKIGKIIMAQRGTDKWDDWGYSNSLPCRLSAGNHIITLLFTDSDNNMNGEVNTARLRHLRLSCL